MHNLPREMIVHACDTCGAAIRASTQFQETLCGECADAGLPTVAHTVCQACVAKGVEAVHLALAHQVMRHGLPAGAIDLAPIDIALRNLPIRLTAPAFDFGPGQPSPA